MFFEGTPGLYSIRNATHLTENLKRCVCISRTILPGNTTPRNDRTSTGRPNLIPREHQPSFFLYRTPPSTPHYYFASWSHHIYQSSRIARSRSNASRKSYHLNIRTLDARRCFSSVNSVIPLNSPHPFIHPSRPPQHLYNNAFHPIPYYTHVGLGTVRILSIDSLGNRPHPCFRCSGVGRRFEDCHRDKFCSCFVCCCHPYVEI